MNRLIVAGLLLCGLLAADDGRVPVIVELFTSEACASCPAADALLARLERTQPVAGVRIIALEEHVDYWNQLGWNDPFAAPQFHARQNEYALAAHVDNIYTPQMIVNGQVGFEGGDVNRAYEEIGRAAQAPVTSVILSTAPNSRDPQLIDLTVRISNPKTAKLHDANLYLAVTEGELVGHVSSGENAGRTLRHSEVVRSFNAIGRIDPKGASAGQVVSTLRLPREWRRENLHAVVFVQEKGTFRITGASSIDLQ
ncbi:MAG TPA: DUF1223 domain-containing protein [Bryobacteraceae bacterium]|nr:DUF1223 domain-containing protein [Bryobacteraceae bacterium]